MNGVEIFPAESLGAADEHELREWLVAAYDGDFAEQDWAHTRGGDIGVLSTGLHQVYSSLGWERWRGESYVQLPHERIRTADDDGTIMVLRTSRTGVLDLGARIVADWRDGDIW